MREWISAAGSLVHGQGIQTCNKWKPSTSQSLFWLPPASLAFPPPSSHSGHESRGPGQCTQQTSAAPVCFPSCAQEPQRRGLECLQLTLPPVTAWLGTCRCVRIHAPPWTTSVSTLDCLVGKVPGRRFPGPRSPERRLGQSRPWGRFPAKARALEHRLLAQGRIQRGLTFKAQRTVLTLPTNQCFKGSLDQAKRQSNSHSVDA